MKKLLIGGLISVFIMGGLFTPTREWAWAMFQSPDRIREHQAVLDKIQETQDKLAEYSRTNDKRIFINEKIQQIHYDTFSDLMMEISRERNRSR